METVYIGLNNILEQSHQTPQNIQNLKTGLLRLIYSNFKNRKTLNVEHIFMKIQYNLIFENKNNNRKRQKLGF
jgi:hypothetical protein